MRNFDSTIRKNNTLESTCDLETKKINSNIYFNLDFNDFKIYYLNIAGEFHKIDNHTDFHYFIYNLSDNTINYFLNNKQFELPTNHLVLYQKNKNNLVFTNSINNKILIIAFHLDIIKKVCYSNPNTQFNISAENECFATEAKMNSIIQEIVKEIPENHLQKLYVQAKALELFSQQFSTITEFSKKEHQIDDFFTQKVSEAKKLIENNLDTNYTIPELAKMVGTNEQYLKQYFKEITNKTIYNYALECKMELSKTLILKKQHKIAEVASILGFKYPAHFSKTFKKYFGYLPQSLKMLGIGFYNFEFLFLI